MVLKNITCPVCANAELRYIPDTSVRIGPSPDTWPMMCWTCHAKFDVPRPDSVESVPYPAIIDDAGVSA